jgi:Leucine-rich repeat (LRR) protein
MPTPFPFDQPARAHANSLTTGQRFGQLELSGFLLTEWLDAEAGGPGGGLAYCTAAGWHVRGLQRLALAHNRLATLPRSVSLLTSLTTLDVAANALVALPTPCLTIV